jgi:hypothetical protein
MLAVHSVLRASQQELNFCLPFPSCFLCNLKLSKPIALLATSFPAEYLIGLFFNPEDGGDMLLRNVDRN